MKKLRAKIRKDILLFVLDPRKFNPSGGFPAHFDMV